ncbi:hypothetical protein Syun_019312 [Stephania yunnanensis]|uniref:Uncharacterized protein n=1 Tax=Stephania yunnanensis TaxID=152371 RepID=A0AAP0IV22_9MAGN
MVQWRCDMWSGSEKSANSVLTCGRLEFSSQKHPYDAPRRTGQFLAFNLYPGNISSSTDRKSTVSSKPLLGRYGDANDISNERNVEKVRRASHNIQQFDFSCPGSKDLVTGLDQYIASRQRKIDEAELCSTQPTFNPEGDVSVDTLTNLEVKDDTQVEYYLIETSEECEVFQIEPEIVIALNEGEDEMNIDVDSNKPEKPQIESEEDQPLVLVQPPTLPCTFDTPYKGVEVRERLQISYTIDTFVSDGPDTIYSFLLEVSDELLNLKEGVHASLPKYVDAPFVVDISKGEGIT